ncbi:MAG: hypothetical protein J7K40_02560 [candidate division Zixibacteria bacterium]|nr:hypothetical protein [candidate division Zixibacteria bacterium]
MMTTTQDNHFIIKNNKLLTICLIFLFIASVGFYLYKGLRHPEMILDDAYFFIRYADNFIAGLGHAWNSDGVQVYGSTSLLHFVVVVCLRWCLPFQEYVILQLSSSMMGFAAIFLMIIICANYTKWWIFHKNYLFWTAILTPLFLLNDVFVFHMLSGMDTMLGVFCNALLILFTLRLLSRWRTIDFVLLIVSAYITYLARPDNIIYAVLFPLLAVSILGNLSSKRALVIKFIIIAAVILAADLLAKNIIFGDPLPLSFYVKQSGFYESYAGTYRWNPILFIVQFISMALPFLIILLLFCKKRNMPLLLVFLSPVVLIFLYYFSITQIMGVGARYYLPALPFLVVSSSMVIDSRLIKNPDFLKLTKKRVLILIIIVSPITLLDNAAGLYERYILKSIPLTDITEYAAGCNKPLPQIGYWEAIFEVAKIAEKAPRGTVIALTEHGYISAAAPHVDIIDPLGLHDRYFAHKGFSVEEFFNRQPDFIWFPHPDYTRIVQEILKSEHLWRDYDYYPTAFDYGIAIRKSSKHFDRLMDIISESWQANYGSIQMKDYLAEPLHAVETD